MLRCDVRHYVAGKVRDAIVDKITGGGYVPPAPESIYFQVGPGVSVQGRSELIAAGGSAQSDASAALGAKVDVATGNVTVYYQVKASLEHGVDWGFRQVAGDSADIELIVGRTVDPDGRLVEAGLAGAATAEGAYDLTTLTGVPPKDQGSVGRSLNVTIPFLDAPGAIADLAEQARATGTITSQGLRIDKTTLLDAALSLKAPALGGAGGSFTTSSALTESVNASYLGSHGWKDWDSCSR